MAASVAPFRALDQPDVAVITVNNVTYRCYVWKRTAQQAIEAAIFVEQADGQDVLVGQAQVRSNANGVDSPRVIALPGSNLFVAHWLEVESFDMDPTFPNWEIGRSLFDVTDFATGWSFQGTVATFGTALYDVATVEGSTTEFVVANSSAGVSPTNNNHGDQITVRRFRSPYAWTDLVWTNTHSGVSFQHKAHSIFTVIASDSDNVYLIAIRKEDAAGDQELTIFRNNADGTSSVTVVDDTFSDVDDGDSDFTCGGFVRTSAQGYLIVAGFIRAALSGDQRAIQSIGWKEFDDDVAAVSTGQTCHGITLCSRPWTWRSGYTLGVDVYCLVGFKSMTDHQEWLQNYGYFVSLDYTSLTGASANTVHPIPVGAIMSGAFDASHGGSAPQFLASGTQEFTAPYTVTGENEFRRANHLSHASGPPHHTLGPDRKTVTVAGLAWQQFTNSPDYEIGTGAVTELQPAKPSVRGYRFYHEQPWTIRRDAKEPAAVVQQYKGANHRSVLNTFETASGTFFTGGVLSVYDGSQVVENGFLWAPEVISVASSGANGIENSGTYYWTATYTWTDLQGQLHRSPPAQPISLAVASGSEGEMDLEIRPMTISMKDNLLHYPRSGPINIEIWRTTFDSTTGVMEASAAGTLLFRRCYSGTADGSYDFEIQDTPSNNRKVPIQTIADDVTNAVLQYADLLPWQLDTSTLQWNPPPPLPHIPLTIATLWNNRIFGIDPEDARVIKYSDEILPGGGTQYVSPEFLDSNTFRFDSRGDVTAMTPMDNQLIVFTRDAIFMLTGEGNDGTGTGSTLALQVLAEGTGCIEPKSVVLGPPGVFFQSSKGFYLLNRDTSLDFITAGAQIEDLIRACGNIRAATLLEDRHQIRLTLNEESGASVLPRSAIYDYYHRMWAVVPMPDLRSDKMVLNARVADLQDACAWRGRQGETLLVTAAQGGVAIERASTSTAFADEEEDGLVEIPLDVTVGWIHVAGIMGLKRVYEIGVQLEKLDNSEVRVDLYYDVDGSYDESSADDTFTWSSPAPSYLRVKPRIQKLSAILIRIYEPSGSPQTENLKITGLVLKVGIKKGARRVPASAIGV